MTAQWRPDSFHPPRWIVDARIPQHRSDFDRALRQARKARNDAKAHDQQLPAWAAAMLNVTYIPETEWPDFRRFFLEIRERLVPRGPPPPKTMAIEDAPKAPQENEDTPPPEHPQAVGRPAWIQYADPATGKLWWWNNLAEEWFWVDHPGEWQRHHCEVAGMTHYYWLRHGMADYAFSK